VIPSQAKRVLERAKKKAARGAELTREERYRLDEAAARRRAREDAGWKRDQAMDRRRELNELPGPCFRATRFGWRVSIPDDWEGGPWSARDEIEILTDTGKCVWVTLIEMVFAKGGRTWWKFLRGRQSLVTKHEAPPSTEIERPAELKSAPNFLDDEDEDRVTTGAGAAYLAAARKKRLSASEKDGAA
jgi:hypothetical protein